MMTLIIEATIELVRVQSMSSILQYLKQITHMAPVAKIPVTINFFPIVI